MKPITRRKALPRDDAARSKAGWRIVRPSDGIQDRERSYLTRRPSGPSTVEPGIDLDDLSVLDHAADFVFVHDLDGRFTYVNPTAERWFGLSPVALLGQHVSGLLGADLFAASNGAIDPAAAGSPVVVDATVTTADGRRLPIEVLLTPIVVAHATVAVLGVARDLAARHDRDTELRDRDERFRLLVENSSDALLLTAPSGVAFYASRPVARILGYDPVGFVGRDLFALMHPDDRDRLSWVFAELKSQAGTSITTEFRCAHADGTFRHVEAVVANRTQERRLGAFVINLRDLSERRRAAAALEESDALYKALFESPHLGILRLDLDGRVVDANRTFQGMVGQSTGRLRGTGAAALVAEADADQLVRALDDIVRETREHVRADVRLRAGHRGEVWVSVALSLVRKPSGDAWFVIATLEDITNRRQVEEDLRASARNLEGSVVRLEQRTRDISLLSHLGDELQACRSPEEAHRVISAAAAKIFPGETGTLATIAPGSNVVEVVATWGDARGERIFESDACWALRKGRPHRVLEGGEGLVCRHVHDSQAAGYFCVPMTAHGELLGLMTVTFGHRARDPQVVEQLVTAVAEHVALALANIRLHETLRSQSIRDPLTGLFNRRYMEESLEREMRRAVRSRQPVGIIMLDLDHFKTLNDTYGHAAGDEVLRAVGNILQRSVRAEDIACRYGGEEFTLILPEASLIDASHRAEHVRQSVKGLVIEHRKQDLPSISVSAGVAIYPDHGPTASAVLRAADAALYHAKQYGRDRVAVHHTGGLFSDSIGDFTAAKALHERAL